MNSHLIIGFGKWAKKNIHYIVKKKLFSEIYVKTSTKFFKLYPKNININYTDQIFHQILKKIQTVHICSPVDTHVLYLRYFLKFKKKIIVEKPLSNNLKSIKNLKLNKNIFVNYIDLLNPNFLIFKKKFKFNKYNKIYFFYEKKKFYKKKYELINDFLDHPLSIVLAIFKNFQNLNIKFFESKKTKQGLKEKIIFNYTYRNKKISIQISNYNNNNRKILFISNKNIKTVNLKKYNNKKSSSFNNLYKCLLNKNNYIPKSIFFHKKIIIERLKIINILKKYG